MLHFRFETVNSLFQKQLSEQALARLLADIQCKGPLRSIKPRSPMRCPRQISNSCLRGTSKCCTFLRNLKRHDRPHKHRRLHTCAHENLKSCPNHSAPYRRVYGNLGFHSSSSGCSIRQRNCRARRIRHRSCSSGIDRRIRS